MGEITSKIGSGATPRGGREVYAQTGVPLIRSMNVRFDGFTPEGLAYLDDRQAAELDSVQVREDDVLLNITGASIGRVCVAPASMSDARVNQHVCIVRTDEVVPAYLRAFLAAPTMQSLIVAENYGLTRQALTKGMIEAFTIPIPPAAEQRRIVAKLDALTARLARARGELDRVPTLAKRLREQAVETSLPLSENDGWKLLPLGALIKEGPSNGWSPKSEPGARGALTLKLTATTSGKLRLDAAAVKRIHENPDGTSKFWLRRGDLLVQRANAIEHVGATAIFDGPDHTYLYPDLMMRLRFDDPVLTRLVWYRLNSPSARHYFRNRATGTAGNMPKISGGVLREVPIALPARSMWPALAAKLDATFARADRLEAEAARARKLLDRLESAILTKAFRGELVRQDPNDEPASVLLERIRAARAGAPEAKRGRKAVA